MPERIANMRLGTPGIWHHIIIIVGEEPMTIKVPAFAQCKAPTRFPHDRIEIDWQPEQQPTGSACSVCYPL